MLRVHLSQPSPLNNWSCGSASIIRDPAGTIPSGRGNLVQRFGYMGERRAEKPTIEMRRQPTPWQCSRKQLWPPGMQGQGEEGCAWCARSPMPGPSGRVWKERDRGPVEAGATQGRTAGAAEEAGWGEGGNSLTSLPHQTLGPSPWLPLVEPAREQSSRQPGNRKTRSHRREEGRGDSGPEPPAHQRPDCTRCLQPEGREGQAPQQEAWGSVHSAEPLGVTLLGPNRNAVYFQLQGLHCSSSNAIISCPALMAGKGWIIQTKKTRPIAAVLKNGYYRFCMNTQLAGDIQIGVQVRAGLVCPHRTEEQRDAPTLGKEGSQPGCWDKAQVSQSSKQSALRPTALTNKRTSHY